MSLSFSLSLSKSCLEMSTMRSYLKPPLPLPKSPIRLRSRQVVHSHSPPLQTPPGSLTKYQKSRRLSDVDLAAPKLPVDYYSMSTELHALANLVKEEFAVVEEKSRTLGRNLGNLATNSVPVFERGRFYEEYSAKRNERLRRKRGEVAESVKGTPYNLGVTHEPMTNKRRGTAKKQQLESVKKTVSMETPRYSLRSMSKENRKPPLPLNMAASSAMKTVTTRRAKKV